MNEDINSSRQTWGIVAGVIVVLGLIFAAGYFYEGEPTTASLDQPAPARTTTGSGGTAPAR
jgi:hypothetical protein